MNQLSWLQLANVHKNGTAWVIFTDENGHLAQMPYDFVKAFSEDALLDIKLVPTQNDHHLIQIVRGGKLDAIVPLGLLLWLRRNGSKDPSQSVI
jgi:hypothetical protein